MNGPRGVGPRGDATAIIETSGLSKRYGETVAVHDLDLRVAPGEVYGFLGPNGAGKTTTIRMLLGLVRPTRGSIRVLGRDQRWGAAPSHDIGALIERPALYPHLTARQNLGVVSLLRGDREASRRTDELLQLVGLDPANKGRVGRYSTGMRQRLALATSLMSRPRVLILDEPTDGLDPVGIVDLRRIVQDVASSGTTVFFSSHLLSEVERVCTRVGILVRGTLVAEFASDELGSTLGATRLSLGSPSDAAAVKAKLLTAGYLVTQADDASVTVLPRGSTLPATSPTLAALGIGGVRSAPVELSLEDLFLSLVGAEGVQ